MLSFILRKSIPVPGQENRSGERSRLKSVLPLLGYILLTGIYTYPWSMHLRSQLPSGGDGLVFVWWFSHIRGALLGYHGLYYSNYVFYPVENIFLPAHISFPIAIILMGAPVAFLFGDIAAFNICAYLSFVLTGYGTYLLIRYFIRKDLVSFVAGCIPAFAPYHYASFIQGQLEAMSIQWLPFAILFCFRLKDRPGRGNAIGLGIFSALVVLTSPYFAFVLLVFLVFFLIWYRRQIFRKGMKLPGIYAFSSGALLVLPFYLPLLWFQLGGGIGGRPIQEFDFYSSDLLSYFLPANFHPLFAKLTDRFYYDHIIGTIHSYVGISILGIALCGAVRHRWPTKRFFVAMLILFFILSLGTSLHVGRLRVHFGLSQGLLGVPPETPLKWRGETHPVLLPFYYLHKFVPFFSMQRYPTRFQIPFSIALALLFGFGIAGLMQSIKSGAKIAGFALLILGLIGFEYLHPPAAMYHPPLSDFYRKLGQDRADFAILQLPIAPNSEYLYYQTVHGKRIMIGYMSVGVPAFSRFVQEHPFLYAASNAHLAGKWYWGEPLRGEILDEEEIARTIANLKDWNVRYIIYHRRLDPIRNETIPKFFEAMAQRNLAYYKDSGIVVLKPEDLRIYPYFRRQGTLPN